MAIQSRKLIDAKQYAEAFPLAKAACENGHFGACNAEGWLYEHGNGVKENKLQAVALYRKACAGGFAMGCRGAAYLYQSGGTGVTTDALQADALYRKACDGGDTESCDYLKKNVP